MSFFKAFMASCLGSLLAFIILIVLMVFFVTALVSGLSSDDSVTTVKDNSVLHLKLDVPITENDVEDPFEGLPIPGVESSIGLLPFATFSNSAPRGPALPGWPFCPTLRAPAVPRTRSVLISCPSI